MSRAPPINSNSSSRSSWAVLCAGRTVADDNAARREVASSSLRKTMVARSEIVSASAAFWIGVRWHVTSRLWCSCGIILDPRLRLANLEPAHCHRSTFDADVPNTRRPAGVAQQPDWDAFANVTFRRRFPVWTLRGFCPGSPDHAPAGFWSTATLKQALKIIPAGSVNFVKRDMLHVAHDSDVSHSTPWRGHGSPAVCQLTSELADASPAI